MSQAFRRRGINFIGLELLINFSMPALKKEPATPLFTNPLEPGRGLTIADLNRYLPALRKVQDLSDEQAHLQEGLFLGDALEGLQKMPDCSVDLIIADPPENPVRRSPRDTTQFSLQEYYEWNRLWLQESQRVLKLTGALYLFCRWRFSGMYHALLNSVLRVRTRITWPRPGQPEETGPRTWTNVAADLWFATRSDEFMFHKQPAGGTAGDEKTEARGPGTWDRTNLWLDIPGFYGGNAPTGDKPEPLIRRILEASSFKLNWVVDPFMRDGGVGVVAKQMGRRFIGFETDQDRVLMAMKRIDQT
jgi:site-specific DNA-methyltransferase (adenine-specific)